MRKIKTATPEQIEAAKLGLIRLREARDLFASAGAERTTARVGLAITSAGGAIRHLHHRRFRTADAS